jgi:hypothetical protein
MPNVVTFEQDEERMLEDPEEEDEYGWSGELDEDCWECPAQWSNPENWNTWRYDTNSFLSAVPPRLISLDEKISSVEQQTKENAHKLRFLSQRLDEFHPGFVASASVVDTSHLITEAEERLRLEISSVVDSLSSALREAETRLPLSHSSALQSIQVRVESQVEAISRLSTSLLSLT